MTRTPWPDPDTPFRNLCVPLDTRRGVRVGALTEDAALHIAARLREWDRREVFACMPDHVATPETLAAMLMLPGIARHAACVHAPDGEPVAALTLTAFWRGVFQAQMVATDRWDEVWRTGSAVARALIGQGEASGMRRAECVSLAGHDEAHRFLRWLGFRLEAEHPHRGCNGETMLTFARVR